VKHTIIREQPVQPPVEKIVLELTPAELLSLGRIVGHDTHRNELKDLWNETPHGLTPVDAVAVFKPLKDALTEAGLHR